MSIAPASPRFTLYHRSVPSDSSAFATFAAVEDSFGAGAVFLYKLLFVPKDPAAFRSLCGTTHTYLTACTADRPCHFGFLCQAAFDEVNAALSAVEAAGAPHSAVVAFLGVTQLHGPITMDNYTAAATAKRHGQPLTPYQASIALVYESFCEAELPSLITGGTGAGGFLCATTYASVLLEVDPYSVAGVAWLEAARAEVAARSAADGALFDLATAQARRWT